MKASQRIASEAYVRLVTDLSHALYDKDPAGIGSRIGAPTDEYDAHAGVLAIALRRADSRDGIERALVDLFNVASPPLVASVENLARQFRAALARADLVSTAEAMIAGDLDWVTGIRRLSLGPTDDDFEAEEFTFFRGLDSSTDNFPVGSVRDYWNPARLEELDAEMKAYLEANKAAIVAACQQVIKRYST